LATPLPEGQDALIEAVAAVNPNTIVVINTNQPLAMPWLRKVKAVLNMWFPGDEGGWATASVLLGRTNPAGRLPFTWPATVDQGVADDPNHPERSSKGVNPSTVTPCTNTASGVGASPNCDTSYSEGIDVGYRWFDSQGYTPLFPFGYGLSYTKFTYSNLNVTQTRGHQLRVSFTITNTGSVAGQEVPQVYLGAPSNRPAGVQFAPRALATFDRVAIDAGHSQRITLDVQPRELTYWSISTQRWQLASGTRTVYVNNSSRGEKLHTETTISD
jgi:beta-glucosidase